jgi:hypothetical protein
VQVVVLILRLERMACRRSAPFLRPPTCKEYKILKEKLQVTQSLCTIVNNVDTYSSLEMCANSQQHPIRVSQILYCFESKIFEIIV